jgi:hypothetical protein
MGRSRAKAILAVLLFAASLATGAMAGTVRAEDLDVVVRITIERIRALDDFEGGGSEDFYAVINIDGEEQENKDTPQQDAFENDEDISPMWEFSRTVPLSRGTIPVVIGIWDEDGGLRLDDDQADITPTAGRVLVLSLDLGACAVGAAGAISGGLTGDCETSLVTAGTQDERAELTFRIATDEPASAPGLRVRCIHDPILPMAGETVTITAEALDPSLAPKLADAVEIWVDETAAPTLSVTGASVATTTTAPITGDDFVYGCRVRDEDLAVWTGWRRAEVFDASATPPPAARPRHPTRPIMYTGPTASRIDIVFVADDDSYASGRDPAFLDDVKTVIRNAYFAEDVFLRNQNLFNFWLATGRGHAESVAEGCDHRLPRVPYSDAAAILHTDSFRDCASGGAFSSEPASSSWRTVIHETGHQPFGLADEYCNRRAGSTSSTCDGGYFENQPFPNLWEEPEGCRADAPLLGRTAGDCDEFLEPIETWWDPDWSISEPVTNDLMVNNGTPQAADVRRIEWIFANCNMAGC